MTTEYLLDAMGLLDDALIQEAEQYSAQKRRARYGMWIQWAASFAVVIALGYGVLQMGFMGGGGNSGGNSAAGVGAPAASAGGEDYVSGESTWNGGGEAPEGPEEPDSPPDQLSVSAEIGGQVYRFRHWYGEGGTLAELPEGCVSLGKVALPGGEASAPCTDSGEYVNCEAWLLDGEEGYILYLELPEGGYLECRQD